MAAKYKKNLIPVKNQTVAVYASPRISAAFQAVTADMDLFRGVKLGELLESVYEQGKKDGARTAFETMAAKQMEAQRLVPHRNPGKPKRRNSIAIVGIVRFLLVCALLLPCAPAAAQPLEDRIRELERRMDQLERRLDVHPRTAPSDPGRQQSLQGDGWRQKQNWRALRRGMSEDDVRRLLGEAPKISVGYFVILWFYPEGGSVTFGATDRHVQSWSEP